MPPRLLERGLPPSSCFHLFPLFLSLLCSFSFTIYMTVSVAHIPRAEERGQKQVKLSPSGSRHVPGLAPCMGTEVQKVSLVALSYVALARRLLQMLMTLKTAF